MTSWGLFFSKHSFWHSVYKLTLSAVHSKDAVANIYTVALLQNLCLPSKFAETWLANTTPEEPEATFFLIVYMEMSMISIYVEADESWRPFGTLFSWLPSPCLPPSPFTSFLSKVQGLLCSVGPLQWRVVILCHPAGQRHCAPHRHRLIWGHWLQGVIN